MKYSLDQDPKNVKNVTVCNSIIFLWSDAMCQGVSNENAKKPAVAHVIPKMFSSKMLLMIIPIQFFIVQMIALFYPNLTLCDQHRKFENTKIANFKKQVIQKNDNCSC